MATAMGMGCLSQICVTGDLTNKKENLNWLANRQEQAWSELKSWPRPNQLSKNTWDNHVFGGITWEQSMQMGHQTGKRMAFLTQIASYFWSPKSPVSGRTSTTASSTTTVLPDPPIPCLAPGAQRTLQDKYTMAIWFLPGLNGIYISTFMSVWHLWVDESIFHWPTSQRDLRPSFGSFWLETVYLFPPKSPGCGPVSQTMFGDVFKLSFDTLW